MRGTRPWHQLFTGIPMFSCDPVIMAVRQKQGSVAGYLCLFHPPFPSTSAVLDSPAWLPLMNPCRSAAE